jgi:hypothetical protein
MNETLTDHQRSIPICLPTHLTLWAGDQWHTVGIAFLWLPLRIAHHERMTASTLSAGVARVDPAGDDTVCPCLIFGVLEDAPLHPEGAFDVPSAAILALLWLEIAQVLKSQNAGSMLNGKLDNTCAHLMGLRVVAVPEFLPEIGVILLTFSDDARLAAVACDASKLSLPKAGYLFASPNKLSGKDRTFDSLDSAHGKVFS